MIHRCNLVVVRTLSKELVNGSFTRYLCSKLEIEKVACREGKIEIEGEREWRRRRRRRRRDRQTDRDRLRPTDREREEREREGWWWGARVLFQR